MVPMEGKPTLRRARQACGLTLQEVAMRAHVSLGTVWQIEAGKSRPTPAYRWWIAAALNRTPDQIDWSGFQAEYRTLR